MAKMQAVMLMLSMLVLTVLSACSGKRPQTLLISCDGFRADKLDQYIADNPDSVFALFAREGVKADYMKPSFPSLTFPNHYAIITGRYPETNGIVGNSFYDPAADYRIKLINDKKNRGNEAQWWNQSDPFWLTAREDGNKTATFFWPGSEVWTRNADIFLSYQTSYTFDERVNEVVDWLSKLKMEFVNLYFDLPDHAGHSYGPDSKEYTDGIDEVNEALKSLIKQLKEINLFDNMNIIIVSDHGFAATKDSYVVTDYVKDTTLINTTKTSYGVIGQFYPNKNKNLSSLYNALKTIPHMSVYYKDETPIEYHYRNNDRIAPIVVVSDEGYSIGTEKSTLKGDHGYDNSLLSMRAIFTARGPNFIPGSRIPGFENVSVYELLCNLVGVYGPKGNGTLAAFDGALRY